MRGRRREQHSALALNPALASPLSLVSSHRWPQEAGKSAGMLTLGVPPSVAARGGFSAADAIFDG